MRTAMYATKDIVRDIAILAALAAAFVLAGL